MAKTYILMPLANDADKDFAAKKYLDVGPNSRERIAQAVDWAKASLPTAKTIWVFGAGTYQAWRRGPTLGMLAGKFLRTLFETTPTVFSNMYEKNYVGTLEEIKWGVQEVHGEGYRPDAVTFIFFGPWWHLLRARVIWHLYFKRVWGRARFVKTTDGAALSLPHECLGYLRILGHRVLPKLIKTHDQTPYPR